MSDKQSAVSETIAIVARNSGSHLAELKLNNVSTYPDVGNPGELKVKIKFSATVGVPWEGDDGYAIQCLHEAHAKARTVWLNRNGVLYAVTLTRARTAAGFQEGVVEFTGRLQEVTFSHYEQFFTMLSDSEAGGLEHLKLCEMTDGALTTLSDVYIKCPAGKPVPYARIGKPTSVPCNWPIGRYFVMCFGLAFPVVSWDTDGTLGIQAGSQAAPKRPAEAGCKSRGLYEKFTVIRNDGRDREGGDRVSSGLLPIRYLVLDLEFDKCARGAALQYASDVDSLGYAELAADLRKTVMLADAAQRHAEHKWLADAALGAMKTGKRAGELVDVFAAELRRIENMQNKEN